jgi:2-C-methyl-D-erythritol 4-phosphate cytidylyltransferase
MQNENLPKQFLPLGTKPIILHTLEKFLLSTRLDAILLGIHPDWISYMEDILYKHVALEERARLRIVPGGRNRSETLFNVIEAIESEFGAAMSHIVVTHDAVRPFVSLRIIEENIDAAEKHGACNTVVPATDTIVESNDGCTISRIPVRSTMYQGQTPQSFHVHKLKELYEKMTGEEREHLTDACKIYTEFGEPVFLAAGDVLNFKITTINDYRIAESMLSSIAND